MKEFIINPGDKTPLIKFNEKENLLSISGRSVPENSFEFYDPIIVLLLAHQTPILLRIDMEYFNTSTSKLFLSIFQSLPDTSEVIWIYEVFDEDMQEDGENYKSIVENEGEAQMRGKIKFTLSERAEV